MVRDLFRHRRQPQEPSRLHQLWRVPWRGHCWLKWQLWEPGAMPWGLQGYHRMPSSHFLPRLGLNFTMPKIRSCILFSDTQRCVLYTDCPTLGPEDDGSVSADYDCDLCNIPGLCDDTAIGIDFVNSREECIQVCKDTPVRKKKHARF